MAILGIVAVKEIEEPIVFEIAADLANLSLAIVERFNRNLTEDSADLRQHPLRSLQYFEVGPLRIALEQVDLLDPLPLTVGIDRVYFDIEGLDRRLRAGKQGVGHAKVVDVEGGSAGGVAERQGNCVDMGIFDPLELREVLGTRFKAIDRADGPLLAKGPRRAPIVGTDVKDCFHIVAEHMADRR